MDMDGLSKLYVTSEITSLSNDLICMTPLLGSSCPCKYTNQPILLLRGLCQESALKPRNVLPQYTVKQLAGNPNDVLLVGFLSTQIRFNDSSKRWVITDAVSKVRAESRASKVSYVLGKHNWTVTGDVFECHEGQPYTTILKMSGCNRDGEFTCDDGQCVTMEQRCDQIKDCIDGSDEMDCNLLVLEEGYKKEVPPFTLRTPGRTIKPAQVNVSINLLRIIDMEEQDHKID